MEFVDGLDLAEIVRYLGPLPMADACELVRQTALALQCAHEHGLVHRDVKPSNVMLARSGEVKLLDLGLARFLECGDLSPLSAAVGMASVGAAVQLPPQQGTDDITGSGQAMGTADYMAPEQASDSRSVDIRADLYSLGCTLYKLLSGRAPFSGPDCRTTLEKLNAHVHQPARSIRQLVPDVPEGLAALLDRLLAKDPDDRPATPAEVAEAIARWCEGADLPALLQRAIAAQHSPPRTAGHGRNDGSRSPQPLVASQRWKSLLAIAVLMLLVGGGIGFALGVITIRIHKDGQTTSVNVPEGSNVNVSAEGEMDVKLARRQQSPPTTPRMLSTSTVAVTELDVREPLTWQWHVILPKGHRYGWNVGYGDIPADGFPKRPWVCISSEPYWETGLDAVLTAALRRIGDKNWSLTVSARSYNTLEQFGGASVTIPDAVLHPMFDAVAQEEAVLGNRRTETLVPDKPIVLLKRRGHKERPYSPSISVAPGIMIWLQPLALPSQSEAAVQTHQPKEPPLQFGPVVEQVVNAVSEGKGGEGLDMANGKLVDVPRQFGKWSAEQQNQWCAENNVDLLVAFTGGDVTFTGVNGEPTTGKAGELLPKKLKLAAMAYRWDRATRQYLLPWNHATLEELRSALASPTPGMPAIEGQGPFSPVAVVRESGGTTYYDLAQLPATFAFQTRNGDLGILQVLRYTDQPRGIRIRYKRAQSAVSVAKIKKSPPVVLQASEKPNGPWIGTLADGVTVELLAVGEDGRWWQPNGAPLAGPPCPLGEARPRAPRPDVTRRAFIARISGLPLTQSGSNFEVQPSSGGDDWIAHQNIQKVPTRSYFSGVETGVPNQAKTVALRWGISSGRWEDEAMAVFDAQGPIGPGSWGERLNSLRVLGIERGGGISLEMSYRPDREERAVATVVSGSDAKECQIIQEFVRHKDRVQAAFLTPANNFHRVELQRRPYAWVEFRGVPTQWSDTPLRSTSAPPDTCNIAAQPKGPWLARLANGACVELVGVSDDDRWWQPNGAPLAEPPCQFDSKGVCDDASFVRRRFFLRLSGLPSLPAGLVGNVAAGVAPVTLATVPEHVRQAGKEVDNRVNFLAFEAFVPKASRTITALTCGVATGPWKDFTSPSVNYYPQQGYISGGVSGGGHNVSLQIRRTRTA